MATTLREALKSRKIAQDAKKPFGTFEDHMDLGSHTLAMKKAGGRSQAAYYRNTSTEHHANAATHHTNQAAYFRKEASNEKPKMAAKYAHAAGLHDQLASFHQSMAGRKTGAIPTFKAKGSIPSAKPKG